MIQLKTDREQTGENWIVEMLLPGVFTLLLAVCLAHLGYYALQAQPGPAHHYAIPAFAN